MKTKFLFIFLPVLLLGACDETPEDEKYVHKIDWSNNLPKTEGFKLLESKFTYLPIYSEVYSRSNEDTRNLTATVSIHNMNLNDSLFIMKADYYNSDGEHVRSYIEDPIFLRPMETADIVIHEMDNSGGTGANFLIEWKRSDSLFNTPLIEGVMISTNGQQGISFTTRGVVLNAPVN